MATCGGQTARGGECFRPLVRVLNHVAGMHALELPPPRSTSCVLNLDNRSPYNWSTHMSCGQPMLPPSPGPRPELKPGSTGKHFRSPDNGFSCTVRASAGAYRQCGVRNCEASHRISHIVWGSESTMSLTERIPTVPYHSLLSCRAGASPPMRRSCTSHRRSQ